MRVGRLLLRLVVGRLQRDREVGGVAVARDEALEPVSAKPVTAFTSSESPAVLAMLSTRAAPALESTSTPSIRMITPFAR